MTTRNELFAEKIAGGETASAAYLSVYDCGKESARRLGSRLLSKVDVRAEIKRLRSAAGEGAVLGIAEKRALLAEIVLTPPSAVTPESPIAQQVTIRRTIKPDGTVEEVITVRMPDKLKALELDARLACDFDKKDDGDSGETLES